MDPSHPTVNYREELALTLSLFLERNSYKDIHLLSKDDETFQAFVKTLKALQDEASKDKKKGQLMLTAYSTNHQEDKVKRVFLLNYRDDRFLELLDCVAENMDKVSPFKEPPPLWSEVVVKLQNPERDDKFPLLKKLGGIHDKPWRGVVIGHSSSSGQDEVKVYVYLVDLGIGQICGVGQLFEMGEEVKQINTKFGGWITLKEDETETKVNNNDKEQRRIDKICQILVESCKFRHARIADVEAGPDNETIYGKVEISDEHDGRMCLSDLARAVKQIQIQQEQDNRLRTE